MAQVADAMISTMVDYAGRLAEAMTEARMSCGQLSKALGVSYQAVKKVIDGKTGAFTAANNDAAARVLGVSSRWLATGEAPKTHGNPDLVAHPVSYQSFEHSLLTREQLMKMGSLPARFTFVLDDDAMGEYGRAGTEVLFHAAGAAKVGAGVLVRDRSGALHVRRKAQGRSEAHWIGVAPNDLYRTLDSEADGLTILAVWRGVVNRGLEDL